jgi:hypothetical protein
VSDDEDGSDDELDTEDRVPSTREPERTTERAEHSQEEERSSITKSPSRKKATIKNQKFPPDFVAIIWYYPRTVFWMFSEISARLRGNYRV